MHLDGIDERISIRKYWEDLNTFISFIRLVYGGIIPCVLNSLGILIGLFLGFKPFRIYDLFNSTVIFSIPSGFMSFSAIFIALLFQTITPSVLSITFELMTGLSYKPNSSDNLAFFDAVN